MKKNAEEDLFPYFPIVEPLDINMHSNPGHNFSMLEDPG